MEKITPWGPVTKASQLANGITFVSTDSHGGFYLDQFRLQALLKRLPLFATYADKPWFEQDIDSHAVVVAFPTVFDADQRESSETMVRRLVNHQTMFPNNWTQCVQWIESKEYQCLCKHGDPTLLKATDPE